VKLVLLILAVCLVPVCGWAQVIVHQAALDQLAGIAVPAAPAVKPAPRVFHYPLLHRVVARAAKPKAVLAVAKPKAPPPVVSVVAPPAVMPAPTTLPPMPWVPVPGAPTKPPAQLAVVKPPPPPRPVMPAVTVGFAPGGADLTAGAPAALQPICKAAHDNGYVSIDAYAPADSTDPSAAMRLSLSRAFAVREALIKCGLPLARLIPRADGAMGHDTGIARITVSGGMAQ
jgi:outer membrane protein OmpA-like peptidoglycan-associated protein